MNETMRAKCCKCKEYSDTTLFPNGIPDIQPRHYCTICLDLVKMKLANAIGTSGSVKVVEDEEFKLVRKSRIAF